ncbi:unnamed protein product [Rotaria socialis]|uniref:CBM21 domain-containing protein n=2 Tax=Rotaria socialis TaxID=392032 RepID=A0A820EM40_9BILA|nr:unnamed protein product [Rotaria socialis]CAF4250918.1 unnamed protein product [Rotaria socialis]
MSDSFLSTDKDDVNNHNEVTNPAHSSIERNDEDEKQKQAQQPINCLSELSLEESDSFFAVLKRLCFYWRRIVIQKIRVILTLIFMSMLNFTTRITCFTGQRTPTSPSSFNTSVSSSSIRTLEEELNNSSKSPLLIEKTHHQQQQQIDVPLLENSTMAQILIQQKMNRSSNIGINRPTTSQKDISLVVRHSVDDRLFYRDSQQIFHFLTRVASEPQMFKHHHSQLTNSNVKLIKSTRDFTISLPISNSSVQLAESKNNEIHFDDILIFNCDQIQPVSNSTAEDFTSDEIDNIVSTTNQQSEERITLTDEFEALHVNGDSEAAYTNGDLKISESTEDVLTDASSSLNDSDSHGERHFRRRKRRSSLTKTSVSLDDTESITDLIEKISIDNETPQDTNKNLKLIESDDKENKNIIAQDTSDKKELAQTIDDAEKSAPLSRYRGRRLRQRFYHHAVEVSSPPQEIIPNISSELYLSHETLHVESTIEISTPQPPTSITLIVPSNQVTPHIAGGRLKHVGSNSSPKKNVRFADSVGRELVEVQYINSSTNGESRELAFLLDLSSSPPSFTKNNIYLPITSRLEHKPWSFDVVSKPTKPINNKQHSKRFYCLFRQPDSEHPDIYLHEVWKSQIKLEHADIPYKSSSTDEQRLYGTLWVANIGYQKSVSIKYTFNNWLNVYENEAQYCCHSNDSRNIDQFQITVTIPKDVDRIDFVLRYCVNGQEYWDNNLGKNYSLQTDSAYTTSTTISLPHDSDFNEMRFY